MLFERGCNAIKLGRVAADGGVDGMLGCHVCKGILSDEQQGMPYVNMGRDANVHDKDVVGELKLWDKDVVGEELKLGACLSIERGTLKSHFFTLLRLR